MVNFNALVDDQNAGNVHRTFIGVVRTARAETELELDHDPVDVSGTIQPSNGLVKPTRTSRAKGMAIVETVPTSKVNFGPVDGS